MKKRSYAAVLLLVAMLLAMMTVTLSATGALPSDSGSGSGTPPIVDTSTGFEITGYTIYRVDATGNKTVTSRVYPGESVRIYLNISDSREGDKSKPVTRLNTSSFVPFGNAVFGTDNAGIPSDYTATVSYGLHFDVTYTGEGNTFGCDIFYEDPSIPMQSYAIALNQLVPKSESSSSSESSSTVTKGTGFVLQSASYGAGDIKAGEKFTLNLSLLSTNGSYSVENVNVGVTLPKEITFDSGNSLNYVGTVGPNRPIPVSFSLLASAIAEEGSYPITINVTGINAKDGTEVKATMDITIPVVQPERFEISNVQIPDYLSVGFDDGSSYTSITLVNKGKGTVYNVSAKIEGEGLSTEEGNLFVGNIAAGGQNTADFTLAANMGGQLAGNVVITYENAKGEEKALTHEFTVTAEDMGGGDMGDMGGVMIDPETGMMIDPATGMMIDPETGMLVDPNAQLSGGMPWWAWLIIALVVVVGVIVLVVVLRRRKARKAAQLLEEDLDDDDY